MKNKIPITLFFKEERILSIILILSSLFSAIILRDLNVTLLFITIIVFFMYFYRDYYTLHPKDTNHYVYAPSFGTVLKATNNEITVFLDFLDPHIQKIPTDGIVESVTYKPGEFNSALFYEKSKFNESITTVINSVLGHDVVVTQIAGQLTRRIVNHLNKGQKVKTGTTYGLIKFGSSVRIQVSPGFKVLVKPGDFIEAGITKIFSIEPVSAIF